MNLISITDALQAVVSNIIQGAVEKVSLKNASNGYLAHDVIAPINLPSFNNSAMDGWVFRFEDYENEQRTFIQTKEVKAGDEIPENIDEGCCYRIFTGAPVPENGTLVIMQENIQTVGSSVSVKEEGASFFKNIRKTGEQIMSGEVALKKGTQLSPAAIGYMASLGVSRLSVTEQPKVTILTTGNELVEPGNALESGQIYESNSAALVAGFKEMGITSAAVNKIPDEYSAVFNQINNQIKENDFLVLTGGISVGDYDFVSKVLNELGVKTIFYKVNQKPGKPFFFGKIGNCSVFALPGNPAAAMSCFYYYIRPSIRKFMGALNPFNDCVELPLKENFTVKGSRDLLLKSRIHQKEVEILDGQSSNMMHTFALANSLTQIEANQVALKKGDLVKVFPF